jgi:glycosyltransferase involved in cell wall biosynthesis
LEIIINDDASTDGTRSIVDAISDRRVRFFQNSVNVGPVRNWNLAIKKASGEFVGLLNHDDLYNPFWLTFAVHSLKKYPHIGWVQSAFQIIDDKGQILQVISPFAETGEIERTEAFLRTATLNGLGPGFLVRRTILEMCNYYDPAAGPGADNDLYLRLAAKYPLYYSNTPLVSWRLHSTNLTHRWGVSEQIVEGFYVLQKAFTDPSLSEELRLMRESCYDYFYRKVISRREELIKIGDLIEAQRITCVLRDNGWND